MNFRRDPAGHAHCQASLGPLNQNPWVEAEGVPPRCRKNPQVPKSFQSEEHCSFTFTVCLHQDRSSQGQGLVFCFLQ
jgi:hypothetical protein